MELVSFDDDTVTIRMDIKKEFVPIASIVSAAATDPNALDPELVRLSEEQLLQLEASVQAVSAKF